MITPTPDPRLVAVVATILQNAHEIVSAFDHVGAIPGRGFDLAACCAMAQEESGGRMVWGADPWDQEAYPKGEALEPGLREQPVTQANYQPYKHRRDDGMQPQGCGITQLTSPELQVAAEKAGGCWVPFHNARVGFDVLRSLFVREVSSPAAFAAYNGSGPAAQAYGQRVAGLQVSWRGRLA